MRHVPFGETGLSVSRIGLGCMSMSGIYDAADDAESIRTLHRAFDLGVNLLDTSGNYGDGHNHELIAKALKGRRERVIVHSKSGSPSTPDANGKRSGSSPEYLTRALEETLRRLRTDVVDVYCMSRVDPDIPVEESVGALAELVDRGLARHVALSEASAESIRRARAVHPVVSLQIEYSLWARDAEQGNIQAVREFGMGFMAYAPLGRGFLAGAVRDSAALGERDRRKDQPRYRPGNFERNLELLDAFEEAARDKGVTPAQLALAWVLAQGDDIIPIPGSKTIRHLEENLAAAEVELSPDELQRIEEVFRPEAVAGDRTREMNRVNV